ncbi:riboflavin synthase subunit beta [Comamonas serinivorans]|uniref:6,7-dimethyl-8-ribityllumazine synthase n=1 Tax=Comamonas serinivorans TaxID=1082851 RepID=A0A1Y0ETY6_9BURK|nr:6,7-dimethyl-8-ribityllumazine synthase [Comamonas serinivorans]ARU06930.1 riboflavin synthase subunit beta [Comamonas serinivorans]
MSQTPTLSISVPSAKRTTDVVTPAEAPVVLPAGQRLAFVAARWHADIVQQACTGFVNELNTLGVGPELVDVFEVPGAFEIPLFAKRLAMTGRYAGVAGGALVVDGGIYRHDFVSAAVVNGLMTVQLETGVPMFSVVLTPHHFHDHAEHQQFFRQHFQLKGQEAARACIHAISGLRAIAAGSGRSVVA